MRAGCFGCGLCQAVNERNYHIFYQLCAGATEQERRTLGLQGASCYHYLSQNGRDVCVDGLNDNEGFQKVSAQGCVNRSDKPPCILR